MRLSAHTAGNRGNSMWCSKCSYGSEAFRPRDYHVHEEWVKSNRAGNGKMEKVHYGVCPQCGTEGAMEMSSPFPKKPLRTLKNTKPKKVKVVKAVEEELVS